MIKILLFAHLQEQAGKSQLEIELDQITVRQLKQHLQSIYKLPQLDQVLTAINEEYAEDVDVVKSGDTVAFIPPVSGG